ncbi:MAG: hypothetical protein WDN28_20690 [Chthoniobacter sp.]
MKLLSPALAFALLAAPAFAADPITLKLWPEGAPGQMSIKPVDPNQKPNPNVVTNITEPTLTISGRKTRTAPPSSSPGRRLPLSLHQARGYRGLRMAQLHRRHRRAAHLSHADQ